MKRMLLMAMAALLSGCCTLPPVVEVPVAVPCPPPPVFNRPSLSIRNLKPESPPAEVERAIAETIEQLGGYAAYLEQIIKGYNK